MPTAFSPGRPNLSTQQKKPVATNAMQFQSTHPAPIPPQIYSTSSRIHVWNPVRDLRWSFFAETANVDCFSRGAPSLMFDAKCDALSAGVSITGVIQGNLELPLPPNSLDSHQRQRQ